MDFAESVMTRDQRMRLRADQADERRQRRAVLRERARLGPSPRVRRGPYMRPSPTDEMRLLDAEARRLWWSIRARATVLESLRRKRR